MRIVKLVQVIGVYCLISVTPAWATNPAAGSEGAENQRKVPAKTSIAEGSKITSSEKKSFKQAVKDYISTTPECDAEAMSRWLKVLTRHQSKRFEQLYRTLDRGGHNSPEDSALLKKSIYYCYKYIHLHGGDFRKSLYDILNGLTPKDAAVFFTTLCEVVPYSAFETNWFPTVTKFLEVLPVEERPQAMDVLKAVLHVEEDRFGRLHHLDSSIARKRMMVLDSLLETRDNLDLESLPMLLQEKPSWFDIVRHRPEVSVAMANCAMISLVMVLIEFI